MASASVLLPPEEKFWRRYSPRHEFPLATVLSIFAHGGVLGVFWLAYVVISQSDNDIRKPVNMDAIMVDGGADGDGGIGGIPGLPGEPNKTELVQQKNNFNDNPATTPKNTPIPPDDFLSPPDFNSADPAELLKDLDLINKVAEKSALKPDPNNKASKSIEMPGVGKSGKGGQGGDGGDGGSGPKGMKGKSLSKRDIFALRWNFKVGDDASAAKDRVEKLVAAGFAIVVTDARGNFFFLKDLKRRPVELEKKSLGPLKDALRWEVASPVTKKNLARELQMTFDPERVVMFLPKTREEQLAAAEARYARSRGRDPQQIRETLFDFILRDGVYEPTVVDQK